MEWLLDYLQTLSPAAVHLTLTGILLLCGLGLPIPEDISLISAGYIAHLRLVNVHSAFAVCFSAVLGGDAIAFFVGRFWGGRLLEWPPARRLFGERKQRRVRAYFRKYGSKVIFIGRFLPGLRFSIFVSAGMLRVRPTVFFTYDALAAVISVPALIYLTYYFGDQMDVVIHWVRRSEYGIMVVASIAVLFVAVKIIRGRRLRRKALNMERTPPPKLTPGSGGDAPPMK